MNVAVSERQQPLSLTPVKACSRHFAPECIPDVLLVTFAATAFNYYMSLDDRQQQHSTAHRLLSVLLKHNKTHIKVFTAKRRHQIWAVQSVAVALTHFQMKTKLGALR